jgi:hypothetical protein
MKILLATANSRNAYIDIEREHRTLSKIAEAGGHSLSVLPAVEISDLRDALARNRERRWFDVLHFSGHATSEHGLHLRGKGRQTTYLGGDILRGYLRDSGISLMVVNACCSESLLVSLGDVVPAVIGATREIRDVAARQFTGNFYRALAEGHNVGKAFDMALSKGRQGSSAYAACIGRDLRFDNGARSMAFASTVR